MIFLRLNNNLKESKQKLPKPYLMCVSGDSSHTALAIWHTAMWCLEVWRPGEGPFQSVVRPTSPTATASLTVHLHTQISQCPRSSDLSSYPQTRNWVRREQACIEIRSFCIGISKVLSFTVETIEIPKYKWQMWGPRASCVCPVTPPSLRVHQDPPWE